MKNLNDARSLANKMVNIGKMAKKNTMAVITNMDVPLGKSVGNSLEVIEAIETLKGNGPEDLVLISMTLSTFMVMLCKNISKEEASKEVFEAISSGRAYNKFIELVKAQGGNVNWIEDTNLFPKAKFKIDVLAETNGYIANMNTEEIGKIACILGAGRETKDDIVDHQAGIKVLKKVSEYVNKGEVIASLYTNKEEKIKEAKEKYLNCINFSNEKCEKPKLIYEVIQ